MYQSSFNLNVMLTDGRENSRADLILGAIVLLALLGKLSDGFLKWLERRLLYWRDAFAGERAGELGSTISPTVGPRRTEVNA